MSDGSFSSWLRFSVSAFRREVRNTVLAEFQPLCTERGKADQEQKRKRVRSSTQADGQDHSARCTRHKRQQACREDSTTDPARSEPRGPQQTQRGRRTEGQTRPSEVRALRAKQDPAWSKAQSGQSPKRPDRPSEVRALRVCEEQTRTCATARRPECQQARVLRNPPLPSLFLQAAGVTFQLPREGRRACLSVVCSLFLFSLLSFFCAVFPGVVQKQGVRSSHSGHPRGSVRSPLVRCYLWLYLPMFWVFGSSSRNFGNLRS